MYKTEALLAFEQVARLGSFTAAAAARGVTAMAISKQVSGLEAQLGEALFERTTRKVRLTGFGEEFLGYVRDILAEQQRMAHWLESREGEVSGHLRVVSQAAQTMELTLFPWLGAFCELHPQLTISFDVQEKVLDVHHDQYDVYWGVGEYLGQLHPGLKRRKMWSAGFGIYASPGYLQRFGHPQTPDELEGHRVIGYPHQEPGNILVVNNQANTHPDAMEYRQLEAPIKSVAGQPILAAQGLGLINALVDNPDIRLLVEKGRLVPVLEDYWFSNTEVFIYTQQVKFDQPKVRAFVDFFLAKRDQWH